MSKNRCSRYASRVYVLQLQGGHVYVGKTSRPFHTRLNEHMRRGAEGAGEWASRGLFGAKGSSFTRLHAPTGRFLARLGNLEGEGDGPERDETLRQMFKRGCHKVRGWKYVRPGPLTRDELHDIECNIRELFDLCRRCGKQGHFTSSCREKCSRDGVPIECKR
jgi:hypothetical protein